MRVVAERGCRQPFQKGLTVVSRSLLGCDEKVGLPLETQLETLVADHLDGLRLQTTPVCGLPSDDFGRGKSDGRRLACNGFGRRDVDPEDAWIMG